MTKKNPESQQKVAYFWSNGRIDIGDKTPNGALQFADGDAELLAHSIAVTAVLSRDDNQTYIVPYAGRDFKSVGGKVKHYSAYGQRVRDEMAKNLARQQNQAA